MFKTRRGMLQIMYIKMMAMRVPDELLAFVVLFGLDLKKMPVMCWRLHFLCSGKDMLLSILLLDKRLCLLGLE